MTFRRLTGGFQCRLLGKNHDFVVALDLGNTGRLIVLDFNPI